MAKAVAGVGVDDLIDLLDEHMLVVKALYPKEYDSVLSRIYSMK